MPEALARDAAPGVSTAPSGASERSEDLVFGGEFLRKLERLELTGRKIFRGLLRGEHATHRRGRGLDFSDFRRYRPGDDFRHIDWNIFSRLDRLFLKLYAAEEDVSLHLIVDASASMGFGSPRKFDQARRIAAALAYVGLSNLDRVSLIAFADGLGAGTAPLKGRQQMAAVLDFLRALSCVGTTETTASMRAFAARVRHPGVVVLISDFLGESEAPLGIDALRGRGHDVVALQLLDEDEIDPPLHGALRLVDAETGGETVVTVEAGLLDIYRRRLMAQLESMDRYCRRTGVAYLRASTAIAFEDVVLRYLRQGWLLR